MVQRRMPCIWCQKEPNRYSREHGIPESFGCPDELVLDDVACARCNNGLAILDQALLKQFEVFTMMLGVPRKRGRPPTVDGWGPLRGWHDSGGPQLAVNGGPGDVEVGSRRLRGANKQNGTTDVWVEPTEGRMGFKQQFGNDPRFVPALYKIGLNLVAKHLGPGVAAAPDYDHVREFVRRDPAGPHMRALLSPETHGLAVPLLPVRWRKLDGASLCSAL